ncbi:hypothetical protein Y1Q_0018935 [Alligator mississippiensis]|uniref:Uncharacterized protein n=1 Tax=Alligator mississippiensis TaxID=8496 RepID=A0A151M380_ALLMI|nr:hypothetical protein Y1Q_0018935 [Alligator mississippiensis]
MNPVVQLCAVNEALQRKLTKYRHWKECSQKQDAQEYLCECVHQKIKVEEICSLIPSQAITEFAETASCEDLRFN